MALIKKPAQSILKLVKNTGSKIVAKAVPKMQMYSTSQHMDKTRSGSLDWYIEAYYASQWQMTTRQKEVYHKQQKGKIGPGMLYYLQGTNKLTGEAVYALTYTSKLNRGHSKFFTTAALMSGDLRVSVLGKQRFESSKDACACKHFILLQWAMQGQQLIGPEWIDVLASLHYFASPLVEHQ
jgi:hypothetical protein